MKRSRWTTARRSISMLVYCAFIFSGVLALTRGEAGGWWGVAIGGLGVGLRITIVVLQRWAAKLAAEAHADATESPLTPQPPY